MTLSKAQDQSAALKGFSQALRHDPLCNNKPLQLALAQQCARNFIGSMRFIARQQQKIETSQIKESVERFHFDFTQASPYSINKLIRIYLQRGWWLRALKLCHWAHWSLTKYKY